MQETNKITLLNFYTAFQNHDPELMAECYADDVVFSDPAFGILHGEDARDMWRMLIERSGGKLDLSYSDLEVDGDKGSAKIEAKYIFSKTGRNVHNKISSKFRFRDGKIVEHHDTFDLKKWAKMALGPIGSILAFTGMLERKVRETALKGLEKYKEKKTVT